MSYTSFLLSARLVHLNTGADATVVLGFLPDAPALHIVKEIVKLKELKRSGQIWDSKKRDIINLAHRERAYKEVIEHESSSSGCFLLSGCSGFLVATGKANCIQKRESVIGRS